MEKPACMGDDDSCSSPSDEAVTTTALAMEAVLRDPIWRCYYASLLLLSSYVLYLAARFAANLVRIARRKRHPPFPHLSSSSLPPSSPTMKENSCPKQKATTHHHHHPLPVVPTRPHWILGHLRSLRDLDGQYDIFVRHAHPTTRLCSFWISSVPSVSVLRADDVRKVLRGSVSRSNNVRIFSRHALRFVGRDSILFSPGGAHWRRCRVVVQRAFTAAALRESQRSVGRCASVFASSIVRRIDRGDDAEEAKESGPKDDDGGGSKGEGKKGGGFAADFLDLYKMVTVDIFGAAALGHDFGCCRDLTTSDVATAFEVLQDSFSERVYRSPLKPQSQFYWLPTRMNAEHRRYSSFLRGLLRDIVQERRIQLGMTATGEDEKKASPSNRSANSGVGGSGVGGGRNLLDHMLRASTDEVGDEGRLTDEVLSDTLMTFLLAGYETTSIALTYATYLLATNPRCDEICSREARAVLGRRRRDNGDDRSNDVDVDEDDDEFDDVDPDRLRYCGAVILEAVRLYPPAMLTVRELEKAVVVGGWDDGNGGDDDDDGDQDGGGINLRAGTRVYVPIWFVHREGGNFPHPLEFVPERWVRWDEGRGEWVERFEGDEDDEDEKSTPNSLSSHQPPVQVPPANRDAFVAFSAGARSCVGRRFAIREAVTVLAALVRDVRFEVDDPPGGPYRLEPTRSGVVQVPSGGMPLVARRREWEESESS